MESFWQVFISRHNLFCDKLSINLKVVSALFKANAEHLLGFLFFRDIARVDLNDVVGAVSFSL